MDLNEAACQYHTSDEAKEVFGEEIHRFASYALSRVMKSSAIINHAIKTEGWHEMMSIVIIDCIESLKHYKPESGVKFTTFWMQWRSGLLYRQLGKLGLNISQSGKIRSRDGGSRAYNEMADETTGEASIWPESYNTWRDDLIASDQNEGVAEELDLWQIIENLLVTRRARDILVLSICGFTVNRIADLMGCSHGNIHSFLKRTRATLLDSMLEKGYTKEEVERFDICRRLPTDSLPIDCVPSRLMPAVLSAGPKGEGLEV